MVHTSVAMGAPETVWMLWGKRKVSCPHRKSSSKYRCHISTDREYIYVKISSILKVFINSIQKMNRALFAGETSPLCSVINRIYMIAV